MNFIELFKNGQKREAYKLALKFEYLGKKPKYSDFCEDTEDYINRLNLSL